MSRAFVTDKEDWVYCAKAGERCMHAEEGKVCNETDCEFFDREIKTPVRSISSVKVVKRKPKDAKATVEAKAEPRRATKKSTLKKPKKWGGRSANRVE
jgi:hypothetical protein